MKIKKFTIFTILLASVCFSLCACGSSNSKEVQAAAAKEATVQKELSQNDYRGGVIRTLALKQNILDVVDAMKGNNTIIREDNPNSYWTTNGYQDFVSNFLSESIISDTQWFNEEETDWNAIVAQISATQNSFTQDGKLISGVTITHNEKDDYSISNVPSTTAGMMKIGINDTNSVNSSTKINYRVLYDCDKDWTKAYSSLTFFSNIKDFTPDLYEYRRITNNIFAIQTSTERLIVVLDKSNSNESINNRKVQEFYYSKLSSDVPRTTFTAYENLPIVGDNQGKLSDNISTNKKMSQYPYLNNEGDYAFKYGVNDTIFSKSADQINTNWVFEEKSLSQGLVYKNGVLVATTYNKLSDSYERFIYSTQQSTNEDVETLLNIVNTKDLINVQKSKEEKYKENSKTAQEYNSNPELVNQK